VFGAGWLRWADLGRQAADFCWRVAHHARVAGADSPFAASARVADSQASASIDKVTWACQARQVLTW
jgi:hypothetical protein